jgi:lipid-binding SYLF domain-containing protein
MVRQLSLELRRDVVCVAVFSQAFRFLNLLLSEPVSSEANHTLSYALDPGLRGIPKGYFMTCAGICIINTVQAGFMFSGSVGTGIFMKRNLDGSWSNPVACGVTGVGFGFLIGANAKEVMIFMPDESSVQTFFSGGLKMGAQSNLTIGVGRELEGGFEASKSGMGATLSIAYSKGAFIGATIEGAMIAPRRRANEAFYGPGNGTPAAIIDGTVLFPIGKETMLGNVKDKLAKLGQGLSEKIGEEEKKKAEAAAAAADAASDTLKTEDSDIMHMDAEAEAAKGN